MADSPNSFGQYKDFTNICGTAFQPYVHNHIEERKKLVSKNHRTSKELQWLDNKTAWIKVSSGVDVDQDNKKFNEKGPLLAQKYTLQSGLINNNTSTLRSGIGPDNAYGIGGNDFGYRPMPGITNLSIKTGGRLGTLREATIDFNCYNKEQLDIMDALYMKLGMSVLVEWGHIPFIDNKGNLEVNPKPLDFYNIYTKEDLMIKIQNNRVTHDGNFDAMWGTIKNWSFSLEENGVFKCQISLVGAGDVLESLKINQSAGLSATSPTNEVTGSPYPVVSDQNLSLLNNALFDIFSKDVLAQSGYTQGTSATNFDYSDSYKLNVTKYLQKLESNFTLGSDNVLFALASPLLQYGYNYSSISGITTKNGNGSKNVDIPKLDPVKVFSRYILPYEINGEKVSSGGITQTDKGAEQVYITLSHLLLLVMATGGIFDQTKGKKNPYIYVDVNPDTNRCYTFNGHISLDPTTCLIGSEKLPFNITSTMFNTLQNAFPFFDPNQPSMGRFMYTLLNVQFIASILKKHTSNNKKGDVYFVDFLQDILDGISKATGGYNEFRIVPDDDTRCVRIFDDKRVTKPLKNDEDSPYTIIPVMGKDSLAYSFNYTSRIPPNASSMIVISSQYQPSGLNLSNEALAFSKLSQGLTNRLSPNRVDSTDTSTETSIQTPEDKFKTKQDEDNRFIELKTLIKGIYNGQGGTSTETEKAEQEKQKQKNANPYYSY